MAEAIVDGVWVIEFGWVSDAGAGEHNVNAGLPAVVDGMVAVPEPRGKFAVVGVLIPCPMFMNPFMIWAG